MTSSVLLITSLLSLFLYVSPVASILAACPLLGPVYPPPQYIANNTIIQEALKDLTSLFDDAVKTGNSSHGSIASNTTSFSVALFDASSTEASPYFYEYHYTAPAFQNGSVDAQTVYNIGPLTQVFTVWATLIDAGEAVWADSITKYVPELAKANPASQDPLRFVDWEDVTLGDLAGHMSGIGRGISTESVDRDAFFKQLLETPPVFFPGSTPVYSDAAFQLLGYALESITGKPIDQILSDSIFSPLNLTSTALDPSIPMPASLGLHSTTQDLSLAGHSILSSSRLSAPLTHHWLRPISHTANPANSVGRPWTIYSPTGVHSNTTRMDIFTALGTYKNHASYLGLVPDYGVGFVILARDETGTPDLNAHADFVAETLAPGLEKAAYAQSKGLFEGLYGSAEAEMNLTIGLDGIPGLAVTSFATSNGTDLLAEVAEMAGIEREALSVRLYPTNLEKETQVGVVSAYRAIIQDGNDLADGGTPTCVSWMDVDELRFEGKKASLDEFVFEVGRNGTVGVRAEGFGLKEALVKS